MGNAVKSYEDLEVWQRGIDLTLRIYAVAAMLPPSEKFELSSQIRRCAVSIPSNIAEGHARRQTKPYLNHVNIALGSLAEWATCLLIAHKLGFVPADRFLVEKREIDRLGQMLHGLARSLEERLEKLKLGVSLLLLGVGSAGVSLFRTLG
jgi:four helix bundle protein